MIQQHEGLAQNLDVPNYFSISLMHYIVLHS